MKEQMKIDLEIIRKNKVEKYAIEYIKLDRQECELQKQGRLSNELLEMFENKKRELVNKSYTYYDEIEKEMTKDLNELIKAYNKMVIDSYIKYGI